MWLNIALMAAILCQCYCMDIDCNNMFPETPNEKFQCYQEETEPQDKEVTLCADVDSLVRNWTVTNETKGTLSVEFGLMPQSCGYTSYELVLSVSESVTKAEDCDNNISPLLHSSRSVKIRNRGTENVTELSPCGKTVTVTFNYVFSGCYRLELTARKPNGRTSNAFSYLSLIKTDYKKDLLINKKVWIVPQYYTALQALRLSVDYSTKLNITRMKLVIRKCDSRTSICRRGIVQHYWEMALSTSGQSMCKVIDHASNKPSCHVDGDAIKCIIHNVTTGFYCVLVEIIDERCLSRTVWNNNSSCLYNSDIIEVNTTSPQDAVTLTPSPPPSPAAVNVVLVVVVLAIVLVCISALVLFCRRRRRQNLDPGGVYVKKVAQPHKPRILLLYCRDCEPFMNMMTTFREMLKQVMMCEVYDCFDPLALEELCQNKVDWLFKHISSPDVKIVLVESKCAVLHQAALMQHMKVIYKEPTWLDDLFMYGLRVLLEDLQTNAYGRVFVVRIHGFTEDSDNLCHVTPFTRYVVPQNTEKLLSNLYQESPLEHVLILKEDSDSSQQRLQDNIRLLQVFKQQNSDYLNQLFEPVMKECV